MSANVYDFQILGPVEGGQAQSTSGTSVQDSAVVAGTTSSISYGDICVFANGYWAKSANGGCASAGLYGVAQSTSTETASADGLVKVAFHPSGLLAKGTPTTPGNLAQAIIGDKVTLDVDGGGVQTVDENDPNGVLVVTGYDATSGAERITVVVPYSVS